MINMLFVEQTFRQCKSTSLAETYHHVPGKEKDQVSPMLILECQRETNLCRILFFNNNPHFFFVIP